MIADRPSGTVDDPSSPGLWRRLACFTYEGVLLFGLVMTAAFLYSGLTQQRHALQGRHGLQALLFIVIGVYFAWFWSRGGQTLAMKTWHLRLVRSDGSALSAARGLARYVLSWLWVLPSLLFAHLRGLHSSQSIIAALAVGILGYAGLARLRRDRRFWHDVICDTRVITWRPSPRALQNQSDDQSSQRAHRP